MAKEPDNESAVKVLVEGLPFADWLASRLPSMSVVQLEELAARLGKGMGSGLSALSGFEARKASTLFATLFATIRSECLNGVESLKPNDRLLVIRDWYSRRPATDELREMGRHIGAALKQATSSTGLDTISGRPHATCRLALSMLGRLGPAAMEGALPRLLKFLDTVVSDDCYAPSLADRCLKLLHRFAPSIRQESASEIAVHLSDQFNVLLGYGVEEIEFYDQAVEVLSAYERRLKSGAILGALVENLEEAWGYGESMHLFDAACRVASANPDWLIACLERDQDPLTQGIAASLLARIEPIRKGAGVINLLRVIPPMKLQCLGQDPEEVERARRMAGALTELLPDEVAYEVLTDLLADTMLRLLNAQSSLYIFLLELEESPISGEKLFEEERKQIDDLQQLTDHLIDLLARILGQVRSCLGEIPSHFPGKILQILQPPIIGVAPESVGDATLPIVRFLLRCFSARELADVKNPSVEVDLLPTLGKHWQSVDDETRDAALGVLVALFLWPSSFPKVRRLVEEHFTDFCDDVLSLLIQQLPKTWNDPRGFFDAILSQLGTLPERSEEIAREVLWSLDPQRATVIWPPNDTSTQNPDSPTDP